METATYDILNCGPRHQFWANGAIVHNSDKLNLQNLPRGSTLRRAIIAPKGQVVVALDSSNIEARMVAWEAGHEELLTDFRNKVDIYLKFASNHVYKRPLTKEENPTERFVGKVACIAEDTPVLTDTGWVKIQDIRRAHKIWDGEEFVCHNGLAMNGYRETLNLSGLWLTPDHLVWSGREWKEAESVEQDEYTLSRALGTAAENLPLQVICVENVGDLKHSLSNAIADWASTQWIPTTSRTLNQQSVTNALGKRERENDTGNTSKLCQTTNTVLGCLTDSLPQSQGVLNRTIERISTMGLGEYQYTGNGLKTEQHFYSMCKRSMGGITQTLRWIGQTLMKGMYPETYALSHEAKTQQISDKSQSYKKKSNVYDVLSCGPRNRFTVWTDKGPLIVHNCLGLGYGMGPDKFQDTLAIGAMGPPVYLTREEAAAIVYTYRSVNAPVVNLWSRADAALTAMLQGESWEVLPKSDCMKTMRNMMVMPNGMALQYPALTVSYDDRNRPQFEYYNGKYMSKVYGGKLCIAAGTLVVTDQGPVPIENVTIDHQVWDGENWVAHEGLANNGVKTTIDIEGVYMTPDHLVLTTGGWIGASQSEGHYRANCRIPEGYQLPQLRRAQVNMEHPMHSLQYTDIDGCKRTQKTSRQRDNRIMRVHESADHRQKINYSRNEQTPSLRRLALNARQVPLALASSIRKLRRTGDNRLRTLARKFPKFLGRYGEYLQEGARPRSHRQQQGVSTGELPMGEADCELQQQTQFIKNKRGIRSAGEQSNRHRHFNPVLPHRKQLPLRSLTGQARSNKQVYDLVNCGPRHRFCVLDSNNQPLIVHNCENITQALARIVLFWQMLEIAKHIKPYGGRVILNVHDEIVFTIPAMGAYKAGIDSKGKDIWEKSDELDAVVNACMDIMRTPPPWCPDLPLDCEGGYDYCYSK